MPPLFCACRKSQARMPGQPVCPHDKTTFLSFLSWTAPTRLLRLHAVLSRQSPKLIPNRP